MATTYARRSAAAGANAGSLCKKSYGAPMPHATRDSAQLAEAARRALAADQGGRAMSHATDPPPGSAAGDAAYRQWAAEVGIPARPPAAPLAPEDAKYRATMAELGFDRLPSLRRDDAA